MTGRDRSGWLASECDSCARNWGGCWAGAAYEGNGSSSSSSSSTVTGVCDGEGAMTLRRTLTRSLGLGWGRASGTRAACSCGQQAS